MSAGITAPPPLPDCISRFLMQTVYEFMKALCQNSLRFHLMLKALPPRSLRQLQHISLSLRNRSFSLPSVATAELVMWAFAIESCAPQLCFVNPERHASCRNGGNRIQGEKPVSPVNGSPPRPVLAQSLTAVGEVGHLRFQQNEHAMNASWISMKIGIVHFGELCTSTSCCSSQVMA